VNEIKLLTAPQVADILQVSVARVYELARSNALPCVRLVRQVRFDERALREFIANGGCTQTSNGNDANTSSEFTEH
jgi:excisionase family DNA binding protein